MILATVFIFDIAFEPGPRLPNYEKYAFRYEIQSFCSVNKTDFV